MSLGAALLQPETLRRSSFDDVLTLGEDVARVAAIIFEDSVAAGPMAGAAERALTRVGTALAASFEPRLRAIEEKLRGRIAGPQAEIERLAEQAEGLASEPAAVIGLVRQLFARLKSLTDAATLPVIRAELAFWKTLIEQDLLGANDGDGGRTASGILAGIVSDYVDALRAELAQVTTADTAGTRRLRLCESVLVRLGLQGEHLHPPEIDIEPLARAIEAFLRSSGVTGALGEFSCTLDGIESALNGLVAAGNAARPALQPVGAGIIQGQDIAEYAWYASWLLNDEDVPLLGLSDLAKPREFLNQLKGSGPVEQRLRELLLPAEQAALGAFAGTADPSRELQLAILAGVNRAMQTASILESASGASLLTDSALNSDIISRRASYRDDQALFGYNRAVIEKVFGETVEGFSSFGSGILNFLGWPRNQVFVTGDRRFVMCDDKPIHVGTNVKWSDAPMFSASEPGQMWFKFDHVSAEACEVLAQVLAIAAEAGKTVWHLVEAPPGRGVQTGLVATVEISDTLQYVLFGKPVSAHFLEMESFGRGFGKFLDSALGLKGNAAFWSALQGRHSEAPFGNQLRFWLTVILGDLFRTLGPIQMLNTARDALLSFFTLLNFRGPGAGSIGLPANPAHNYKKGGPFVSIADTLFGMLLISLYPRDNYSIFIWTKGGIGDRRLKMFLGHWLGGSAGLGFASGLVGSLVAQVIAWGADARRLFTTAGFSALKMFVSYWVLNYLFRENTTDGGRYKAGGGNFRGYPDRRSSPYRLPYAEGKTLYVGQGNLALFSHNFITNSDFAAPANSATQQVYAYDFGHDLREGIACARAGVVWSFSQGIADSDEADWNTIVIKHATIDPVHDDFGNGPVQTFAVYGHLAHNGVTQAPAFGGTPPAEESMAPGTGTPVPQGDIIALAGDTGMSFHNHLHMHVVPDDGTGAPAGTFAIPFVFGEVAGDGVPKSRTWHRSGNR